MQVTYLDTIVCQVVGQLLGHALGQCGDQHALVFVDPDADFTQHIIDLVGSRTHLYLRVYQTGGAHDLLDHLPCMLLLVSGWCGGYKNRLPHLAFELFKLQRPVVQRTGQPKAIVHQVVFARPVAVVHGVELANHDVTFVQEHHRVFGHVIAQRRRRRACRRTA